MLCFDKLTHEHVNVKETIGNHYTSNIVNQSLTLQPTHCILINTINWLDVSWNGR